MVLVLLASAGPALVMVLGLTADSWRVEKLISEDRRFRYLRTLSCRLSLFHTKLSI